MYVALLLINPPMFIRKYTSCLRGLYLVFDIVDPPSDCVAEDTPFIFQRIAFTKGTSGYVLFIIPFIRLDLPEM